MEKRGLFCGKEAQVWVETVVYTLIGLTIIGIVIGIITPKIKQMTDKAIIEQTISAMAELNDKVYSTQTATGQSRLVSFRIKKGSLVIDGSSDTIYYVMEATGLKYSQPGAEIKQGDLAILTETNDNKYNVYLKLKYDTGVTFDEKEEKKVLTQAPTAYQLLIENKGGGKIDVRLA